MCLNPSEESSQKHRFIVLQGNPFPEVMNVNFNTFACNFFLQRNINRDLYSRGTYIPHQDRERNSLIDLSVDEKIQTFNKHQLKAMANFQ